MLLSFSLFLLLFFSSLSSVYCLPDHDDSRPRRRRRLEHYRHVQHGGRRDGRHLQDPHWLLHPHRVANHCDCVLVQVSRSSVVALTETEMRQKNAGKAHFLRVHTRLCFPFLSMCLHLCKLLQFIFFFFFSVFNPFLLFINSSSHSLSLPPLSMHEHSRYSTLAMVSPFYTTGKWAKSDSDKDTASI